MNNYQFLVSEREQGRFGEYMRRRKKAEQEQIKKYSAALTMEMGAILKSFAVKHPDWEPDEIKLTVKCVV